LEERELETGRGQVKPRKQRELGEGGGSDNEIQPGREGGMHRNLEKGIRLM